jgi:UDP-N-acetylmuramoyl-tripeptide--D-alanyl-D-alanine ligase
MRPISVEHLADIVGGELHGDNPNALVQGFATDSNGVKTGDAFLAIRGARVDGHEFVPQALQHGAITTVAEREVPGSHIRVPNLVDALARFGRNFRIQFNGPVVGITGSAGKTTTKEFVAAALSPLGPVLKTEGNRNSEYTAPLLWGDLTEEHRAVVVEMAMRGFDQIAHLAAFSQPTIGLITNIGYSHLEQVGSREGIARAKGELLEALPTDGQALLWAEDEFLDTLRPMATCPVRTFGFSEAADCRVVRYQPVDWQHCVVTGTLDGVEWEATLPAVGRHMAINAAAAVLTAQAAGVSPADAATALASVQLPPMRMEIRDLNGATVMLDTYNAAPPSMIAAIETLAELPVAGKRRAVVGVMRELGEHAEAAHRMVGQALAEHRIDEICFVGEPMAWARQECLRAGLSESSLVSAADHSEIRAFLTASAPGDAVLVKGSRALELEKALP